MADVGIKITAVDQTGNAFNSVTGKLNAIKSEAAGLGGTIGNLVGKFSALGVAMGAGLSLASVKNAIDVADQFSKMAQKTGVAVEALRQLNYAASLSDVSTEALGNGLKKLSINMAAAAGGSKQQVDAFKAIGLSVKDASGNLKSADAMLTDVAAKFATFKDGPEKAALAVELFGKAGADMIPLLNAGASGLKTMAEEADALGATFGGDMAKNAEAFNDNLTRIATASQGAFYSIANELLPTLNQLSQAFLDAQKSGSGFGSFMGTALKTGIETVAIVFSDVKFVLEGVGREIGGIAAQIAALGRGDLKGFTAISDAMKADAARARAELDKWQFQLLNAGILTSTAGAGRGTAADPRLLGSTQTSAPIVASGAAATAKTISEASKGLALYNDLMDQATGFEKTWAEDANKLRAALDGKTISQTQFNAAANALLQKQPVMVAAAKAQAEAQKEITKELDAAAAAQQKAVAASFDELEKAQAAYEAHGKLASVLQEENLARLENARLITAMAGEDTSALDAQIANKRKVIAALQGTELKNAADDLAKANQKAAEESGKFWEDALMRAFESGKGFFASLWDTIKNTLKTQVLRVLVSATGLTGMTAAGASELSGGGGNLLGTAANLGKMYDTITGGFTKLTATVSGNLQYAADWMMTSQSDLVASLGESLSANVGTLSSVAGYAAGAAAGLAIGKAISGGYGSNTAVNAGTVIGSVLGGPIGGAIGGAIGGLVNRAFGRGPTQLTSSGTRGTFSGDSFSGQNYANYKKDGGWFRSDKNWTDISAMDSATADVWSTAFAGVKGSVAGMAASLGLATDKITSYSKYIDVAAGTTQEALTAIFTGMADEMATAAAPAIAEFAKSGETASVTLQRLSGSLTTANAWLSMLRNRLFNVSLAGADAASKLADAFGGLDNLAASSKTYYDAFYSEAERTAISTENIAKAMALVNVALPATKDAFRDVVSGLDLTTESGRNAYAVMLALAPEFDAAAQAADRMAQATAAAIIKAFSGNRQLVPVLNAASLAIGDVAEGAGSMTTGLSYINKVMGDSQSGVITLGGAIGTLGTGMTQSQKSAALLAAQIADLEDNADRARINFAGLGEALANVDTATFVATVALMFESLADRIGSVLDGISAERIAVREAALQIINPTVMSKEQIARGIAGINTGLPNNLGAVAAQQSVASADANVRAKADALNYAKSLTPSTTALDAARAALDAAKAATAVQQAGIDRYMTIEGGRFAWWVQQAQAGNDLRGSVPNPSAEYYAQSYVFDKNAATAAQGPAQTAYDTQLAAYSNAAAVNAVKVAEAQAALTVATAAQAASSSAAQKAALDYAAALQTFAIDAGKSVTKLGRLREETVKYYEAQKALADLMGNSAAGLRKSVADYRYGQLSPEQQLASLQSQFSTAYSMALASQGDGATLAGYGDKLNSLLGPLIDKLGETGGSNLVSNYLAQAESIASLIESNIPVNYQQDSLNLLGSIDATLAALEASSLSAEAIISNAVAAGADRTATGLRTIGEAISGKSIPAFALGGSFGGGVRLVGENGPELEVTGPSRIFSADQTRSMLGGNTARLEALVERLTQKVEDLNAAAQATAGYTNKTAKLLDRAMPDGDALATRVAA